MADTTTCPANIGSAGRFARVTTGILALLIGAGLTWTLAALHWDSPWLQISVAIPFFVGMLGLLQAKEKTCVVLAAKGERSMGKGVEAVTDTTERSQLRKQGIAILWRSLVGAVVLTAASVLIQLFLRQPAGS
jgi:hypothetical protein